MVGWVRWGLLGLGRGGGCAASESAKLLVLKLDELLLAVHLDDQGDDEDEESGASDPGGLACRVGSRNECDEGSTRGSSANIQPTWMQ